MQQSDSRIPIVAQEQRRVILEMPRHAPCTKSFTRACHLPLPSKW